MKVFALHKPTGVTCDLSMRSTARGRRHADLKAWFESLAPGLRHVGRLDKPTTGLLLAITPGDDRLAAGKLTRKLLDPGSCSKTYVARVKCGTTTASASSSSSSSSPTSVAAASLPHNQPTMEQISLLRDCVELSDGRFQFDSVEVIRKYDRIFTKNDVTHITHEADLRLTICIGKNRIVRRMLAAVGLPVVCLTRVAIGRLRMQDLPIPRPFDSVQLTTDNIDLLLEKPECMKYSGKRVRNTCIIKDLASDDKTNKVEDINTRPSAKRSRK